MEKAPLPIQFQELLYRRQTFQTLSGVFNGVMLWDFIICVPAELRYIFYPEIAALCSRSNNSTSNRLTIPSLLLLCSRLLVIPIIALSFSISLGQPLDCKSSYQTLLILYSISNANACGLFIIRTIAIRKSRWPLQVFLWTLWLTQTSFYFYWATLLTIKQVPAENKYQNTCQHMGGFPDWTWIMYLSVACIDILNLILTLQTRLKTFHDIKKAIGAFPWIKRRKDLAHLFYQDTIMQFVIGITVSLALAGWIFNHRQDDFYTVVISPIHVWLNLTISPRVIRSLKLYSAKASLASIPSYRSRSQSNARSIASGVSIEVKRFTTSDYFKPQPSIPFESRKATQINAADKFCPPSPLSSTMISPLSPCQVQFEPFYNDHHRPASGHPFSRTHEK